MKKNVWGHQLIALTTSFGLWSGVAEAGVITFSGNHGDVFYSDLNGDGTPDSGFEGTGLAPGVTVTVENFNRVFDLGVIFDTTRTGTADPDLQDPWTGGNLASTTVLGGIAIIQENKTGFNPRSNSSVSNPDDEANRPAGAFTFTFDNAIDMFGFDIIDVEGRIEPFSTLHVMDASGLTTVLSFAEIRARDNTIQFGNNSLNRIIPITTTELGTGPWTSVTLTLGGSGGIDNVNFRHVPEPAALLLFGVGLVMVSRRLRK